MNSATGSRAWIFVSHSSDDIENVRRVRNYLEERGASPLMFHLVSLQRPQEFWPVIEREIGERNFFLYCESEAAERSEWVRRERKVVDQVSRRKPIRIGRVDVRNEKLDTSVLDRFLEQVKVFPMYGSYEQRRLAWPYLETLTRSGFMVFSDTNPDHGGELLSSTLRDGWVLEFLTAESFESQHTLPSLRHGFSEYGSRFVPVVIEKMRLPRETANMKIFDATKHRGAAQSELVRELLSRS